MTIKQTGGIFGRSPTFNDVDIDGDLTVAGDLTVQGTTITVDSATAQSIVLGDNDKMTFGDGPDLEIYSDGTTGQIAGNVNVTGTVTADGLTVSGAASFSRFGINSNPIDTASAAQSFVRFNNTGGDFYLGIEGGTGGAFFPGSTAYGAVLYNAKATPLSFYTNAAERMRITSTGSVGIGTSSPASALDVVGTVTADGLTVESGGGSSIKNISSVTQANIRLGSTFTTGTSGNNKDWSIIQSYAAYGDLVFRQGTAEGADPRTSGVTRLNLANNGDISFYEDTGTTPKMVWKSADERLGIGTAAPLRTLSAANLAADAQIFAGRTTANGNLGVTAAGGRISFGSTDTVTGVGYEGARIGMSAAQTWTVNSAQGAHLIFETTDNSSTTLTERMRIDSSGLIQAVSSIASDPTNTNAYWYNKSGVGPTLSGFRFSVRTGATPTEAFRVDESGNLLVGKTAVDSTIAGVAARSVGDVFITRSGANPLYLNRLSNDGDIVQFAKDGATVGSIGVKDLGGGLGARMYIGNTDTGLYFQGQTNNAITPCQGDSGATQDNLLDLGSSTARFKDLYLSGSIHGDVKFENNAGTTEYARFDSSGNLLVGTTSTPGASSAGCAIRGSSEDILKSTSLTTSKNQVVFYNPNGAVGTINTNGSATTYNTSSDYRLKEDVHPMSGASDRLMQLNPVNFAWKADGTRVDGFLAHEAQAVVPEAVTGEKDAVDAEGNPEYQGIDQSKLVPLLTAALQEALTEIADLKARVAALEA